MKSKYEQIKRKTRLLVDEAISAVKSGFADNDQHLRPLEITQLEQRILMSASPLAATVEAIEPPQVSLPPAVDTDGVHQTNQESTDSNPNDHDTSAAQASVELVVIDPSADDHQQLVADLQSQQDRVFEILVLNPIEDGVAQITEALQDLRDVSAIHLVSHGDEGEILLGTSVLSQRSIGRYAAEMVTWQYSMTADADLLIYGCDLAASAEGIELTESLNVLLGTDVAASDDDTGHSDLGGDWQLELTVGQIETSIAFTSDVQQTWQHTLSLEALYFSTSGDVSGGGAPGTDTWDSGSALVLGNPNLALGSGTTNGTVASLFDLDALADDGDANLNAMHYVSTNITVGGANSVDLLVGDILFSTDQDEEFNGGAFTLEGEDIGLFRPDTPGDYSSGTFSILLDELSVKTGSYLGPHAFGISLVEQTTTVGDVTLNAGDFIYANLNDFEADDIMLFETADVGAGTTSGTRSKLLNGTDIGFGASTFLMGLELIETPTTIGGESLAAGTILVQASGNNTDVGTSNISTSNNDIISLVFTDTTLGSGTAIADASIFARGADIGLDTGSESFDSLAVGPSVNSTTTVANLTAAQDTYISKDDKSANYGTLTGLTVNEGGGGLGNERALLQFDLSAIPAGATIASATLELTASSVSGGIDVGVYEVTEAWDEGSGGTDTASWDDRTDGVAWSDQGGTFDSTIIDTFSASTTGVHSWDVTSLAAAWASGSKVNNGLMLASEDSGNETIVYDSSEGTNVPRLIVTYAGVAVNTAPTADAGGPYTISESDSLTLDASSSSDPDGNTLTYAWDLDNDGNFGETAEPITETATVSWPTLQALGIDSVGTHTIGLQADDGNGGVTAATTTLTITSAPPVATDDSSTTPKGTAVTINLTDNDIDSLGNGLTVLDISSPGSGTVVDNQDGTVTFTPAAGFSGSASFDYVIGDQSDGLTHFYNLNGNANDVVGGADGALQGGVSVVAGASGQALLFDEIDDYVELPDIDYNNEFTVSFKFKVDDNVGGDYLYLYSHGTANAVNSLNVFLGEDSRPGFAGTIKTVFGDNDDSHDLNALNFDASAIVGDGNWHTYTLTVDTANGASVYLDGVLRASDANRGGDAFNPSGNAFLGARENLDPDRFLGGGLDSVAVFDRSLNSVEVSELNAAKITTNSTSSATVVVSVTNGVPTANAGLTYGITEGETLTLDGSASTDPDGDALTYEWDLNYDGSTFASDVTGESPTVEWSTLFDNGIRTGDYTIAVRASDGSLTTAPTTATLTVNSLPTTQIAQTTTSITTDGVVDAAWAGITPIAATQVIGSIDDSTDLAANWRSTWDSNNFYFLVEVSDDDLQNDSGSNQWHDDGVELFIDADNSRRGNYDSNDFHFGFRVNDPSTVHLGNNSVQDTTGVQFQILNNANGYVAEVSVPWTLLGVTPAAGMDLGVEIQVIDDDGGGNREGELAWNDISDQAFVNTALFGKIELEATTSSTLIVDTTSDVDDGDTSSIAALYADKGADGKISLREAILAANATANGATPDRILFDIPDALVGGAHTIDLTSALPDINEQLIIDGTTEGDFSGSPVIVLNGSAAGAGAHGLKFKAGSDGSTIRGLAINQFGQDGIRINDSSSHTIVGNYIGTDAGGLADLGNDRDGIFISSSDGNTIGGSSATDRNVIIGNTRDGILLSDSDNNVIQGNYVGLAADGVQGVGHNDDGIEVRGSSSANIIGGAGTGEANVVVSNNNNGIELGGTAANNLIQGNLIGTTAGGASLGNATDGIRLHSNTNSNTIGGTGTGEGNVIANNARAGISTSGTAADFSSNLVVIGNSIVNNASIAYDTFLNGVTTQTEMPVLTTVKVDGTDLIVSGTITGDSGATYQLAFYANPSEDATGYGEAERFLGTIDVTMDAGGATTSFNQTITGAGAAIGEFVTATARTSGQSTTEFSQNVQAIASNTAPTASITAFGSIQEGGTLTLDASGSSDPENDGLTYAWDLNYGGSNFTSDFDTDTVTLDWSQLTALGINDDGNYQVALRVNDGALNSAIVEATLTVTNTAPSLSIVGDSMVGNGELYTLNLGYSDVGDDSLQAWTINWGDGTIETIAGDPGSVTHTYTNTGFTNNILVSARDEDGVHTTSQLYVASPATDELYGFDATSGDTLSVTPVVFTPIDVVVGPDGLLYSTNFSTSDIDRYDPVTGQFVDTFIHSSSAGLNQPSRIAFGPDGSLFVGSQGTNEILRYGNDGRFLETFVTAGAGGLDQPDGLTFGPDGNLYVLSRGNGDILKFDGTTGDFVEIFASFGGTTYGDLSFKGNGNLLASSIANNVIREFDALGNVVSDLVTAASGITSTSGFSFGPDGRLYVADFGGDRVMQYEANGTFIGEHVTAAAGLEQPIGLTFTPALQVKVNGAATVTDDSYSVAEGGNLSVDTVTNWFNASWKSRQQITIDTSGLNADLSEFTVLVKLHQSAADAINIDYAATQDQGQDLRFVDPDGTLLNHEIETWDEGGYSYVWVKIPVVDANAASDSFSMYYNHSDAVDGNNTEGAWAGHFSSVLHLNTNTIDSTANSNNGVLANVTVSGGISGGAGTFNGVDSQVNLGSDPSIDNTFAGGGTLSAWINPTGWGENGYGRIADKASSTFGGGSNGDGWALQVAGSGTNGYLIFEHGFTGGVGEWRTTGGSINLNTWQHVAVVYDDASAGNNPQIYIDGVLQTLTENKTPTGSVRSDAGQNLMIGNHSTASTRTFAGQIDEFRISSAAATAEQMAVYHENLNGNLLTSNGVESGPGGVLANDSDADGDNLTVSLISGPVNDSTFTLSADGSFTYVHDGSETTTDSFTYAVSDGFTTSAPITVALTIDPVNDNAPEIAAGQMYTASESATVGSSVGTATATDADSGTTFSAWTIVSGNGDGIFSINDSTGEISVADTTNLNFDSQSSYTLGLSVSDGTNTSAVQTVTINVTDANNNAPVVTAGQTFNVRESASDGTLLGAFSATDGDSATTFSNWTITAGNDDGVFALNPNNGRLRVADSSTLNFESQTNYSLTVTVSDGTNTSASQSILINVGDVNEFDVSAVIDANPSTNTVVENSANGTLVGITASAFDGDASNNAITFSLDNSAGGRFTIDNATGEIAVANGSALDFESATSHAVVVKATSSDGSSQTENFLIAVENANEFSVTAVADSDVSANAVMENATIGTSVGITASATDADGPDNVTYSLTVNPGGNFAIDSVSGEVTTNSILDRESVANHSITVTATSTDGSASSETFSIVVQDENDNAPEVVAGQAFDVSEFAAAGESVGTLGVSDPDQSPVVSNWTIVSGNADGVFAIDSGTGEVTIADSSSLDFETTTTYALGIEVSDGIHPASSGTVTINVLDENDPPTISPIANIVSAEDADIGPIAFTISDIDTNPTAFSVTAESSDQGLVRDTDITITGTGANRFVSLTPVANANGGPVTITLRVAEGANSVTTSFDIRVTPINDAPSLTGFADQTINEDETSDSIEFTISDVDHSVADLVVTATSDNQSLISDSAIQITGTGANRSIQFTPETNANGGPTEITVTVSDGIHTSSESFKVTVLPVNDAPTMSTIPNASTNEDTSIGPYTFTIGDAESSSTNLTITATSSDQNIVKDSKISLGGTDENRTISVTPEGDAFGAVFITLTISDGDDSTDQTFRLTVDPVNDAPTISGIADLSIDEDQASGRIAVTVEDNDDTDSTLSVSVTSSDQGLIADNKINVTGGGSNRVIRFRPESNAHGGPVTLTVSVSDGELTSTTTFNVNVAAVNDAPQFAAYSNFTFTVEDNYTFTSENGRLLKGVTDVEDDLFTAVVANGPSHGSLNLESDGTFTYVADVDYSGIDTFEFYVTDGETKGRTATVRMVNPVIIPAVINTPIETIEQSPAETSTEPTVEPESTTAEEAEQLQEDAQVLSATEPQSSQQENSAGDSEDDEYILLPAQQSDDEDADAAAFSIVNSESAADEFSFSANDSISTIDADRVQNSGLDASSQYSSSFETLQLPKTSGLDPTLFTTASYEDFADVKSAVEQVAQLRETLDTRIDMSRLATDAVATASMTVFATSVFTAVRTGVLALGFLTQLPVWTMFDPLMVMDGVSGDDGDSLEEIVDRNAKATEEKTKQAGNQATDN